MAKIYSVVNELLVSIQENTTLDTVHSAIIGSGQTGFRGSRTTLQCLLKYLGFSWQRTDGRRALLEDLNIAASRITFVRQYNQFKEEVFHFVFINETWIFSKGNCLLLVGLRRRHGRIRQFPHANEKPR
ncbi:hypothetical protein PR048_003436 [Dryococelus australis]|uniref:Uncharacterized protein n=1 Tax=Dryococelus australis TaxID=614101 RepID=A0ABQ9IN51_9NEOP|nr:hypothetical protein PR048_003436 [Dryococelus australis]